MEKGTREASTGRTNIPRIAMSLPNHISEAIPKWKLWRAKNRDYWNAYCRDWKRNNPERVRAYQQRRNEKHPERVLELRKRSNARRKQFINDRCREYYAKNKDRIIAQHRDYERTRRKEDAGFRCEKLLKNRIVEVLKRQRAVKSSRVKELIGCDRNCLVAWIESKFQDGMTWQNHGYNGWHIDHIRPCASFDLSDVEQQKQCFHYTNLQPLWAKDNQIKGNKITT